MKKVLKVAGWIVVIILVLAGGAYGAFHHIASGRLHRHWDVEGHEFPIPVPLGAEEVAALRAERVAAGAEASDPLAGVDLAALARERAVSRGRHLVASRLSCGGCHGEDFGGQAIIDAPAIGRWVAPNLTSGQGSVTRGFTARDWDRAVRHGIKHTGESSSMPSEDFLDLTDHELSDVVAYLRTVPPVDRDLGGIRLGPLFAYLVSTDPRILAAYTIDHARPHPVEPPAEAPTAELGEHIVQICRGCHGPGLSGGKVPGDPNMPIVANITPHETGLAGWTEADFLRALRDGRRPDGSAIKEAMPWKAFGQMSDAELKAVWAYLQTVPPREHGQR